MPLNDDPSKDSDAKLSMGIVRLQANPTWSALRKQLVLFAYKKNGRSIEGIEDFVQEAIARFVSEHGHDLNALGGDYAVLELLKKKVVNARDRHRQTKANRTADLLAPDILAMSDGATHPEKMLLQNRSQTSWENFIERVEALAAPSACAKLLMEGFDLGEDDIRARAAGFTQTQINNERKRLKRLGRQAAREMGIDVPDEDDDEGEQE
jgi:hypothetical protein